MKRKLLYIACIVLLWCSCKKSEELVFPQEFNALNIWLGTDPQKPDSLTYNYAFKSLNDMDTISFSVRLTGLPSAVDREFQLKAIGGDTLRIKKDVHYVFPKYVLKANTYAAVFPIYFKRTSEFKNKEGKIIFGLKENDTFKKGIAELSDMIVILKDQFSKPDNWDTHPAPFRSLASFFGTYSEVKFQFITTAIGLPPTFKVRYTGVALPPSEISYTQAQYYQNRCKIELVNYNLAHPGKPLRNEYDELVTFPN
ncbi:DUF4843 domain-containing protein [Pedobacter sp.]|uniref:DUF4843 domain-containing protein n=1 Tax=Pedobacter sp. TaxID=1411316 RepID=UPI003D7F8E07